MTEERKIRYEIALVMHTRPMSVFIEKVEELDGNKRKIYATVKQHKIGCIMDGDRVVETWRVVA